jgi:SAM-dependent methyltransferase
MESTLSQVLEVILHEMPDLMSGLNHRRDKIVKTLDSLSLQRGEKYLSVGIGKNLFPLIVAMHGIDVRGVDIDEKCLNYQKELAEKFDPYLRKAGGSLTVYNFNVDDPNQTEDIGGFETPGLFDLHDSFDIVEFLNVSSQIGDTDSELAHILLNFGKPESRYLISTFGGPSGKNDITINALIAEAEGFGKRSQIVNTSLFVSNKYNFNNGVLLRVYGPPE